MKTKYILHGGFPGHANPENDKFFQEILKDTSKDTKILLVYFAKELDKVPACLAEDKARFLKNKVDKKIFFEVANELQFEEQLLKTDVVYLHGGNPLKIMNTLKMFSNLKSCLAEKVVVGESAGAYALSTIFYSEHNGGILEGLGFLPIKTICHYVKEKDGVLNSYRPDLELLVLSDYQFKVYQ